MERDSPIERTVDVTRQFELIRDCYTNSVQPRAGGIRFSLLSRISIGTLLHCPTMLSSFRENLR